MSKKEKPTQHELMGKEIRDLLAIGRLAQMAEREHNYDDCVPVIEDMVQGMISGADHAIHS